MRKAIIAAATVATLALGTVGLKARAMAAYDTTTLQPGAAASTPRT